MTDSILVYTTVTDLAAATALAKTLVEERLVACANIIPQMQSIYRWEGRIEVESEVLLLLKSQNSQKTSLIQRIRELHDYECPAVTVIPIVDGNPDFLAWIAAETKG